MASDTELAAPTVPLQPVVSRRGRGEPPTPMDYGDDVIRLKGCPDCGGRGYFLIQPFATGGGNGAGGISNMTQCLTCKGAHDYYKRNKRLPDDIAKAMRVDPVTCLPANVN